MQTDDIITFITQLYQDVLHHPSTQDMGISGEEQDDELTACMSDLLNKYGINNTLTDYQVKVIDSNIDEPMFIYVSHMRIEAAEFDLMGNLGERNIIEGHIDRHFPHSEGSFKIKETRPHKPREINQPLPWETFMEERISAFADHGDLDQATTPASRQNRHSRL